jgi:hypothetical protein
MSNLLVLSDTAVVEFLGLATNEEESKENGGNATPAIAYEALSYTWGDDQDPQEITLNGRLHEVYKNLWDALYFLQEDSPRTMWIDALCIDQSNIAERNAQVEKMHLIYKQASSVVVFLGVPEEDSDLAFNFMVQIYDYVRQGQEIREDDLGFVPDFVEIGPLVVRKHVRSWLAIHELMRGPWWRRAWTLQELLMSKKATFVCGPHSMSWPVLKIVVQVVRETSNEVEQLINSTFEGHLLRPYKFSDQAQFHAFSIHAAYHFKRFMDTNRMPPSRAILFFLEASQKRLCKFPHDKIYSILGILPSEVYSAMPKPDYGQSIHQVYQQIAQAYVNFTRSLDIICESQHSDTQDALLPSWTPDWRRGRRMRTIYSLHYDLSEFEWHSDRIQKYPPTFDPSCGTVYAHGLHLGIVQRTQLELALPQISKQSKDVDDNSDRSFRLITWNFGDDGNDFIRVGRHSSLRSCLASPGHEEAANVLLGVLHSKLNEDLTRPTQSVLHPTNAIQSTNSLNREFRSTLDDLKVITQCRTVIETDSLLLCLAPFWVEAGDIVCRFIGCTSPTILRPNDAGGYRFVGECYVYGTPAKEMIKLLEELIENAPDQLQRLDIR